MRIHWICIFAFFAMLRSAAALAQASDNMIFNPSFEDFRRCPQKVEAMGVMSDVEAWWQPTAGSSDYFNVCGGRECAVPRNKMGYQQPHSGAAYCGIYCSQENYREYIQTELKSPLVAGVRYRVSFWVSLSEKSPHAVATIGALFSKERLECDGYDILMLRDDIQLDDGEKNVISVPFNPQYVNDFDSVLADTKEWKLLTGEFVAEGGERFLTIGNFNRFNKSNVVDLQNANAVLQGAYYYIDDVSLFPVDGITNVAPTTASLPVIDEVVPMWNVFFATGESAILPQSYNELHRLYTILSDNPALKVELRGHTDSQGTVEYNQKLSEMRAHAVAEYLIEKGIAEYRIISIGYGELHPIDLNDTDEGRKRNRRVEYRLYK